MNKCDFCIFNQDGECTYNFDKYHPDPCKIAESTMKSAMERERLLSIVYGNRQKEQDNE